MAILNVQNVFFVGFDPFPVFKIVIIPASTGVIAFNPSGVLHWIQDVMDHGSFLIPMVIDAGSVNFN